MFLFREPSEGRIEDFLNGQREASFSYAEVGASREGAAAVGGYTVDHGRARLGAGEATFHRAVVALRRWRMFDLGWVRAAGEPPIEVGTTVAVVGEHYGFWSLNACRIVYRVEEVGEVRRYGFAYGTLPEHAARGEERFTVEWNRVDGSVWYDLYAFSRPRHPLARLGYPFGRTLQRRFARDSKRAMVRAVGPE